MVRACERKPADQERKPGCKLRVYAMSVWSSRDLGLGLGRSRGCGMTYVSGWHLAVNPLKWPRTRAHDHRLHIVYRCCTEANRPTLYLSLEGHLPPNSHAFVTNFRDRSPMLSARSCVS